MNYTKNLPRDAGGAAMQEYPAPLRAVTSVYHRENLAPSSVITLNQNTSAIEIGVFGGQGAVIRWVASTEVSGPSSIYAFSVISSGLGANWDHFVPAGVGVANFRRFVVPKETQGAGPVGGLGIGSIHGLYQQIAISNAGPTATSVLLTQY